jgi:hypothetical protein
MVRTGASYQEIGHRVGLPAGQVYMIVTGLPADGSDVLAPERLADREGLIAKGSSQYLANPPTELPKEQPRVKEWIKARARADTPMQRAAAERTAEPPAIRDEDATDDVISVLGREHNQVKYLLEQLETIPGVRQGGSAAQQQRRVSIVDMIRERLAPHETAEEAHLWPAVRKALPDGDALADQALAQEQEGNEILAALEGLPGDDERFDDLVEKLGLALRKHVAFEDGVFLAVTRALPEARRGKLGRRVRKQERRAPTREHPHAPHTSPLGRPAAARAAAADRLRDAVGERPAERKGKEEHPPDPRQAGDQDSDADES